MQKLVFVVHFVLCLKPDRLSAETGRSKHKLLALSQAIYRLAI